MSDLELSKSYEISEFAVQAQQDFYDTELKPLINEVLRAPEQTKPIEYPANPDAYPKGWEKCVTEAEFKEKMKIWEDAQYLKGRQREINDAIYKNITNGWYKLAEFKSKNKLTLSTCSDIGTVLTKVNPYKKRNFKEGKEWEGYNINKSYQNNNIYESYLDFNESTFYNHSNGKTFKKIDVFKKNLDNKTINYGASSYPVANGVAMGIFIQIPGGNGKNNYQPNDPVMIQVDQVHRNISSFLLWCSQYNPEHNFIDYKIPPKPILQLKEKNSAPEPIYQEINEKLPEEIKQGDIQRNGKSVFQGGDIGTENYNYYIAEQLKYGETDKKNMLRDFLFFKYPYGIPKKTLSIPFQEFKDRIESQKQ